MELVPQRDGLSGLCISYLSEHWSLRTLALMLPSGLASLVDWGGRRATAQAAQRTVGVLQKLGALADG